MASTPIIEVKNLSKTFVVKEKEKGFRGSIHSIVKPKFKHVTAVEDISFEVEKGEILASQYLQCHGWSKISSYLIPYSFFLLKF